MGLGFCQLLDVKKKTTWKVMKGFHFGDGPDSQSKTQQ